MDVWKAGSGVYDLMQEILKRHHVERLFDVEDKIQIIFREKAGVAGGRIVQGKTRKANPILKVLHSDDSMFIIEIAADEWQNMTDKEKYALLDHHLCSIHVTENKQGERKFTIAPPDFQGFKGEIERHGVWRYANTVDEEDDEDVISALFGPEGSVRNKV